MSYLDISKAVYSFTHQESFLGFMAANSAGGLQSLEDKTIAPPSLNFAVHYVTNPTFVPPGISLHWTSTCSQVSHQRQAHLVHLNKK